MKQEMTERQAEIAIALREVAKTPENESWGAFIDFISAAATMVEGVESLVHPAKMQPRFAVAWQAYAEMWQTEYNRIIRDCLGSQEEFDRVKSHPNGGNAIGRILSRVKQIHGELTPGMAVKVDVGDILLEELGGSEFGQPDFEDQLN